MIVLLTLVVSLVVSFCLFLHHEFTYWKRRHFPYSRKYSWVMGNITGMGSRALCDIFQDVYDELKSQGPLGGIFVFFKPAALVTDPNVLRYILIKDFEYFHDRATFSDDQRDPLCSNLFSMEGERWKRLRAKLTPTFSSGKIKMMFGKVETVADEMQQYIDHRLELSNEAIEWKDVLTRFTVDVIGTCAFGIECSSFHHKTSEFKEMGLKVFGSTNKMKLARYFLMQVFPGLSRALGFKFTDTDVERFFFELCRDTLSYRREHNISRNDFFNLLMQLQKDNRLDLSSEKGEEPLSFNEFVAQCFVFFIAGFETSSILMTFILYELAKHPNVQEKLRREIKNVLNRNDGALTYDCLSELSYLDCVVNEVLRLYPPLINLQRVVTKDYKVPDTEYLLKKGDFLIVPLYSIQRDPQYFPNPSEFIPERFNDENIGDIKPFTFLPFGDGPRVCVGQRFGMMEIRVGLVTLLKQYKFTVSGKMPKELLISPYSGTLMPAEGMWLNVEKIKPA